MAILVLVFVKLININYTILVYRRCCGLSGFYKVLVPVQQKRSKSSNLKKFENRRKYCFIFICRPNRQEIRRKSVGFDK